MLELLALASVMAVSIDETQASRSASELALKTCLCAWTLNENSCGLNFSIADASDCEMCQPCMICAHARATAYKVDDVLRISLLGFGLGDEKETFTSL